MIIEWSNAATADIGCIRRYLSQDNLNAAKRMVRKIHQSTKLLGEQPACGRPGRVHNTRELIISGTPYIVAYTIRDHKVLIVRVIHAARKWPEVF